MVAVIYLPECNPVIAQILAISINARITSVSTTVNTTPPYLIESAYLVGKIIPPVFLANNAAPESAGVNIPKLKTGNTVAKIRYSKEH